MNTYILYKPVQQMRKVVRLYRHRRRQDLNQSLEDPGIGENEIDIWKIEGGGFLFSVLKKMFSLIDR